MKKSVLLSVVLAAILILSACAGEPEATAKDTTETEAAVTDTGTAEETETEPATDTETDAETIPATETEEETTEAVTTEAEEQITAADFVKTHAGYWTEKENGEFIRFYEQDGEGCVSFEMWEAGGPFPSGTVNEVEKTGDGDYTLKITISEQPDDPESYGEGWASYEYTMQVTDKDVDPVSIEATAPGGSEPKTYYFHTEAENPFVKSGEDVKEAFISAHEGYWSNENGNFFYISSDEGGRIAFAVWNAGGPFPSGVISDVEQNPDGSYTVTVNIDAMAGNDENDGWEARTYEFTVTDRGTEPESILAQHLYDDSALIYRYHTEPEYPFL